MDEIIDLVDENDQVIGKELKSICHAKNLLHRGSAVLCFEDESLTKILLNKRSLQKKEDPGKICIPGGHISTSETYLAGAKREFSEEMLGDGKFSSELEFEELFKIRNDHHEFITLFKIIHNGSFLPDPEEVEEYYFENISTVMNEIENESQLFTHTTKILLAKYAENYLSNSR